jgi:signal recognition particle GTPase
MKNSGDGGICGLYFKRLGAGYGALQYFVFELKRALQYSHLNIRQTLSLVHCQDDNIQQLLKCLELWYSRENKDRPLSLFLVGVSGVGKTYTAELLAEALRPYMYDFSYSRLCTF